MKQSFLFLSLILSLAASAQDVYKDCKASFRNDTLTITNSRIERKWAWNGGNVIPVSMTDKTTGRVLLFEDKTPSFNSVGRKFVKASQPIMTSAPAGIHGAAHLAVAYTATYDNMEVKRVFKIYPSLPTVSTETYLKYNQLVQPVAVVEQPTNGVEKPRRRVEPEQSYTDRIALNSRHWALKAVAFKDQTDDQDNLVTEQDLIAFRGKSNLQGNVLLAHDLAGGARFFVLKEAPNTTSQLGWSGMDFIVTNRYINLPFTGFPVTDSTGEWQKGYTLTVGVAADERDCYKALHQYAKSSINYSADKHEMVMMNTWGDRGQDGKISERFILRELEAAHKLGITHFQIDDGWQQGLSQNSASTEGRLWDSWTAENWQPNKERFPNGLDKVIQSAKEKNIQLGLWFHPTNENEYRTWKRDADILIGLYRAHSIKYFKIDGVKIQTKEAEVNFTKMLDEVKTATANDVFFNLDATANIRGGYWMFRNAGNVFLENRYTDAGVYFPFHTLRNLWMLAKYFPPELLQIEFLNKWRNADKYAANDPFAPGKYNFDYLFAVTMAAQPLAWMEGSNLPPEAASVAPLIKQYTSLMADMHKGTTLPIGDEPNGLSWTGFHSMQENQGYLLVFREATEGASGELQTWLPAGAKPTFTKMLGSEGNVKALPNGKVQVSLPKQNSFVLYRYTLAK